MSYVLTTRYYGPTDHKGSRIRVTDESLGKKVWFPYDYAASDPHISAAGKYAAELGRNVTMVGSLSTSHAGTVVFTMS